MRDEILSLLKQYQGSIVLDTGLFIEFYENSKIGNFVRDHIIQNMNIDQILIHDLLISEIYYILCRKLGKEAAYHYMENLLSIATVEDSSELRIAGAQIKCERSISLSVSYACAIAAIYEVPVFFKEERELEKEKTREEFDFDLYLI